MTRLQGDLCNQLLHYISGGEVDIELAEGGCIYNHVSLEQGD